MTQVQVYKDNNDKIHMIHGDKHIEFDIRDPLSIQNPQRFFYYYIDQVKYFRCFENKKDFFSDFNDFKSRFRYYKELWNDLVLMNNFFIEVFPEDRQEWWMDNIIDTCMKLNPLLYHY